MDDIEWWFLEISHQQKILQGIPWYEKEVSHLQKRKSRLVELRSPGGTDWLFLMVSGCKVDTDMVEKTVYPDGI